MPSFFSSPRRLICLALLLQYVSATSTPTCSDTTEYSGSTCASQYIKLIQPHFSDPDIDINVLNDFRKYLNDLPETTYIWYSFWDQQKSTPDDTTIHCQAIDPIADSDITSEHCLCQLKHVCDVICDDDIQNIWLQTTNSFIEEQPYKIPYDLVTNAQCVDVLSKLTNYESLCSDTQIYIVIEQCAANGTPSPGAAPSTPSPTVTTTTASPIPTAQDATITTTTAPIAIITYMQQLDTTLKPTTAPIAELATTQPPSVANNDTQTQQTSRQPSSVDLSYNDSYNYDDGYDYFEGGASNLDYMESFDTPSTTMQTAVALDLDETHPFANLLLVSLIILGFCVFVAWYAKKNQITSVDGRQDDDGYLWGLNKSSSEQGIMGQRGGRRHKKLSDFDDDTLEERMKIEMSIAERNNDDLLCITPDHISRLATRGAPPNDVNMMKKQNKNKMKMKRRTKGGKFERIHDDDEQNDDTDDGSDSEDGVDMMKMRDQYYASQTFSKKLADTLGDIHDTVKVTAAAVKTKLSKKEATVVVPMQIGGVKSDKKRKKKKNPFTIVDDNDETDALEFSEDSSQSDIDGEHDGMGKEYRENICGQKIKQPMPLPTFNDDEEEEVEQAVDAHVVNVIHNETKKERKKDKKRKHRDKKDKDKKRKKKKRHRGKEEDIKDDSHDINITINNDEMGFGTDELDDNIEPLTKEEEVMTMNDLQKELMKHNDDNDNKQEIVSVDVLLDSMVQDLDKNSNDLSTDVVGNGTQVPES